MQNLEQVKKILEELNVGICSATKKYACITCKELGKNYIFELTTLAKHCRHAHDLVFPERKLERLLLETPKTSLPQVIQTTKSGVKCDSCEYDFINICIYL